MADWKFIICVVVANWSGIAFGYLMWARSREINPKDIKRMQDALWWIVNHTPNDSVHHVVARHALGEGND
jgi:hypothetical protein